MATEGGRRLIGTEGLCQRSWVADDLLAYCMGLDASLADSPLLSLVGLRLDHMRVPLKVQPYDHEADQRAAREREHSRRTGNTDLRHAGKNGYCWHPLRRACRTSPAALARLPLVLLPAG
jgi:hypothetical protein